MNSQAENAVKKIKLQFPKKEFFILSKKDLAYYLFCLGMVISYLGSLNPWFLWPVGSLYPLVAFIFFFPSIIVSEASQNKLYSNNGYAVAFVTYIITSIYITFASRVNINGHIVNLFHILTFFCLFYVSKEITQRLCDFLSKMMGALLAVSIAAYFLYLIGFPFPSFNASFGDYSYSNYLFFLIDDRALLDIFPRFCSYFLEPGHLGTATVMLLTTQIGRWNLWYNKVLIVATLMTFSLAAYVLFVVLICLKLWIQRKQFVGKLIGIAAFITILVIGSFYYNNGDNLLHNLIVIRMEVNDQGELAGNNRTTEDFQQVYDNFLDSNDIYLGRGDEDIPTGNSGYQVFLYRYGLVGIILILALYIISYSKATDKRAVLSAFTLAFLAFLVRGYPLWDSNFIPLFVFANSTFAISQALPLDKEEEKKKEEHSEIEKKNI